MVAEPTKAHAAINTAANAVTNFDMLLFRTDKRRNVMLEAAVGQKQHLWIAFGVQILLAGICTTILFTGRWMGNPWLPAEAFAALAAASLAGYFAALDALSVVAERKKEVLIETLSK